MSIVEKLLEALGPQVVVRGVDAEPGYLRDWASPSATVPLAVVLPRSTAEVSTTLRLCNEAGVPVVPQGGMTGLVQGAQPRVDGVALNLSRLRGTLHIDQVGRYAVVPAGTTLQELQEAAAAVELMFPVDFGSRGTCQLGGAISTNAGGVHVLHYGMMREQVLGLEVVLADGTVVDAMNRLIKNNTGFDIKQLFIGSEGTLGVVTQAVLRLRERSPARTVALVQVRNVDDALRVLRQADRALPGLSAFEAMWPSYYSFATHSRGAAPIAPSKDLILLIEVQGSEGRRAQDEATLLDLLENMSEKDVVVDAAVSQSEAQCKAFWDIREANTELGHRYKRIVGFDISLPSDSLEAFVEKCHERLNTMSEHIEILCFGHLGDGNLHLGAMLDAAPDIMDHDVKDCVLQLVARYDGSISAEHGIGYEKLDYLPLSRKPAEIELMSRIKLALDPRGILNRGKLLVVDGV